MSRTELHFKSQGACDVVTHFLRHKHDMKLNVNSKKDWKFHFFSADSLERTHTTCDFLRGNIMSEQGQAIPNGRACRSRYANHSWCNSCQCQIKCPTTLWRMSSVGKVWNQKSSFTIQSYTALWKHTHTTAQTKSWLQWCTWGVTSALNELKCTLLRPVSNTPSAYSCALTLLTPSHLSVNSTPTFSFTPCLHLFPCFFEFLWLPHTDLLTFALLWLAQTADILLQSKWIESTDAEEQNTYILCYSLLQKNPLQDQKILQGVCGSISSQSFSLEACSGQTWWHFNDKVDSRELFYCLSNRFQWLI